MLTPSPPHPTLQDILLPIWGNTLLDPDHITHSAGLMLTQTRCRATIVSSSLAACTYINLSLSLDISFNPSLKMTSPVPLQSDDMQTVMQTWSGKNNFIHNLRQLLIRLPCKQFNLSLPTYHSHHHQSLGNLHRPSTTQACKESNGHHLLLFTDPLPDFQGQG